MGSTQFNSIAMQPNYVSAPNVTVSHLSDFRSGLYLTGHYHNHFGLESRGLIALLLDPYI